MEWKTKTALPQGRETPPYKHPGVSSFQGARERKKNPEEKMSYHTHGEFPVSDAPQMRSWVCSRHISYWDNKTWRWGTHNAYLLGNDSLYLADTLKTGPNYRPGQSHNTVWTGLSQSRELSHQSLRALLGVRCGFQRSRKKYFSPKWLYLLPIRTSSDILLSVGHTKSTVLYHAWLSDSGLEKKSILIHGRNFGPQNISKCVSATRKVLLMLMYVMVLVEM